MNVIQRPPKTAIRAVQTTTLPAFDVRDFMGHHSQVRMVLDAQIYVLRITRAGKLILTK